MVVSVWYWLLGTGTGTGCWVLVLVVVYWCSSCSLDKSTGDRNANFKDCGFFNF